MSEYILSFIGLFAAALTSFSYIPQLQKAWRRGATDDISLKMLVVLCAGLSLWIVYGLMKGDWVLVIANLAGASLVGAVLGCKIRDLRAG
ncbi:MAG: SemiSWEET transporter [Pseudomonadota bacterium]|jgi:MtN3 and saliva related transmembrane protein